MNTAKSDKPRIAVLEFTADSNVLARAQSMNNLKQISLGVVTELNKVSKIDAIAIKQSHSPLVNQYYQQYLHRSIDPAGAVKIGKLLGVNYVMTGHVKVFDGKVGLQTQMVKVSSGTIVWTGPVIIPGDYNSDGTISSGDFNPARNGNLQITQFVVKPAIQMLTASLKAADL